MDRFTLLAVLLPLALTHAQFSGTFPSAPGGIPALGPGSEQPVLVNPKRMQMSQSVTMSAGSGGGGSFSQTFYQNRIDYRLSDPLTLHLNLGLLTPLQSTGVYSQGMQKGTYLVPDVGLEYRPSESTVLSLRYTSVPSAPLGSPGGLPWR